MDISVNSQNSINTNSLKKQDDTAKIKTMSVSHPEKPMPLNSFNKYLVNFKGLNRNMGKRAYIGGAAIKTDRDKYTKSMGIVGNLPYAWIEKIPKEQRKEKIKEIYMTFKEAIVDLRKNNHPNNTSKKLSEVLHTTGILEKEKILNLKYLDAGLHGKAYQIQGLDNDKYVLKVFNSNNEDSNKYHGNFVELNRAQYWQKNAGKSTQRVEFFFGDMDAGYMINQFIGNDTPVCKKNVPEKIYGLNAGDEDSQQLDEHNQKKGYSYDFGGLEISSPELVTNKTVRFVYKNINQQPKTSRLQEWNRILDKYKKNNDIKIGLIVALSLLNIEDSKKVSVEKLLVDANNELKKGVADRLSLLPNEVRVPVVEKLLVDTDNEVKKVVAGQLYLLPNEARVPVVEKLLVDTDNEVKKVLAGQLYSLP
ncbi:MAG: hypothetical protein WC197_01700 [Candidatus Gastranaerophilaceae bacterium]|jgi:hypothetical protein